jgi:hypothetical protein
MDLTSLRKYPTPEGRPPADAVSRRQVRLTTDLARFVLVLAFLGADRWAQARVEQDREIERQSRDPVWVYEQLADRYDFDKLDEWCGLKVSLATPEEVARLENAAIAAGPREAMCAPGPWKDKSIEHDHVWLVNGLEWYRLHDPAAPHRWVGVAVKREWNSGWSPYRVWCRVKVGF